MAISRIISVVDDTVKFIKRKLDFFADYLRSCICQLARECPDQKDINLSECNHGSPTDDLVCCMTSANCDCEANENKVQVNNDKSYSALCDLLPLDRVLTVLRSC